MPVLASSLQSLGIDYFTHIDYAIYNIKGASNLFAVDFFKNDDGTKPVGQFIRTLDVKMKAKVVLDLHRLEMLGNEAREPLSKHLEDDIFEISLPPLSIFPRAYAFYLHEYP